MSASLGKLPVMGKSMGDHSGSFKVYFQAKGAGFGKGELSGLVANLRAFMVIIAAPIFGQISMVGRRHNFPGGHLVAIAACTALCVPRARLCACGVRCNVRARSDRTGFTTSLKLTLIVCLTWCVGFITGFYPNSYS